MNVFASCSYSEHFVDGDLHKITYVIHKVIEHLNSDYKDLLVSMVGISADQPETIKVVVDFSQHDRKVVIHRDYLDLVETANENFSILAECNAGYKNVKYLADVSIEKALQGEKLCRVGKSELITQ